jgi:DinB superfamily
MSTPSGFPERSEAAPYYFGYIERIKSEDVIGVLERQLGETLPLLRAVSEERSLYRYEPGKWSIRELLGHVSDTERVFLYRALWFARGFDTPLPSFDEKTSVAAARSDQVPWSRHVEEFGAVREATVAFFRNLPPEGWMRRGTASDKPFTTRALAYVIAGHLDHHLAILRERYLR